MRRGSAPAETRARFRLKTFGLAATVLTVVVVASQLIEVFINSVLRPDLAEWTWISEVLVIAALLVLAILWARLRLARTAIAALEREQLRVHAELAVAARVQRGLLPLIPPAEHGIVWDAVMEPAGEIGGDYYDFFRLDRDQMCVVLADVSGKGVPAAVFVSNTRAVIRAVARESRPNPAALLAVVSDTLLADGRSALYVTCIIAMVDLTRHTMVYANAGHPAGVVLGAGHGGGRRLDVGGPPLGLIPGAEYVEAVVPLTTGDLVVLVSDGITEAMDVGGAAVPAAIESVLTGLASRTPQQVCAALVEKARRSAGPAGVASWADDRTVVAFAVTADDTAP